MFLWLILFVILAAVFGAIGATGKATKAAEQESLQGGHTMPQGKFEFHGSGLGFLGQYILSLILCIITFGLFIPWAYTTAQKWLCQHTTIDGRPLTFKGSGVGFFGQYLLIVFLTVITFGLYAPWGYCRFMRWQTRNTYFAGIGDNEQSGSAFADRAGQTSPLAPPVAVRPS